MKTLSFVASLFVVLVLSASVQADQLKIAKELVAFLTKEVTRLTSISDAASNEAQRLLNGIFNHAAEQRARKLVSVNVRDIGA